LDVINRILLTLGDAAQWGWHDGLGAIGSFFAAINDLINPALVLLFTWINVPINALGSVGLSTLRVMPGWLSNTVLSGLTGILLLVIFKYTSNQKAIGRVKDEIKANMLALKLFKDELSVVFRAQGRVFYGAVRLLRYSLFPLLVMIIPVSLELAQMGLWYQWRPLGPGESALVTLKLAKDETGVIPEVTIEPNSGFEVALGPVRILSKHEVCWNIQACQPGYHDMVFRVGDQRIEKQLAVGNGFMRISAQRPGQNWLAILVHPLEAPLAPNAPVHSVSIDYPSRASYTSGSDWWLIYFFGASLVFALIFKPFLNIKI